MPVLWTSRRRLAARRLLWMTETLTTKAKGLLERVKWARVAELEMELDGKKITRYRTTAKIYFEIEK